MAVLTLAGINFSNGTSINSKYEIFPQTSAVVFWQSAAPSGWVTVASNNNRALRVVSGVAAGTGGTNDFTTTMADRTLTANVPVTVSGATGQPTTLDANSIPAHSHPAFTGAAQNTSGGGNAMVTPAGNTGNFGNSGAHAHPIAINAANGPISTPIDFRVQYIDVIYCTFS